VLSAPAEQRRDRDRDRERTARTGVARFARAAQRAIDVACLAVAYVVAFALRFDGDAPWYMWKIALFTAPYVVFLKYGLLSAFGVPQFAWRYIGLREAVRIAEALALASASLVVVRVAAAYATGIHPAFRFLIIPFGVIAIDAVLSIAAVVGVRTLRRVTVEYRERTGRGDPNTSSLRTLIVGAGDEGFALARAIEKHPELGIDPVGFVDDDEGKRGTRIHGIRVLGGLDAIPSIVARHGIEQAILALANPTRETTRDLLSAFDGVSIPVKVVPSLESFVTADRGALAPRPIELEDLLRRSTVTIDDTPVDAFIRDRVVVVTGAGGSIGSELARQIARYEPRRLLLVERSEHALYEIARELSSSRSGVAIPILLDVTRESQVDAVFAEHRPSVVFHAAAHKHVPLLEQQPAEAVRNNLLGTKVVADAAIRHGAESIVLVSTDKAVNPSSVMGASKRTAELYLQSLASHSKTRVAAVRFGNVLGSSGSVVPLFREQIARRGPVTVTHPEMRRYFMTIPEACHLVLHAGAIGRGGEIFILDMGEPVRIVDLAEDLIRLSGLVPGRDVAIEFTGIRPGEKLFEELSVDAEQAERTSHPKIFTARVRQTNAVPSPEDFVSLLDAAARSDDVATMAQLERLVPEIERPEGAESDDP